MANTPSFQVGAKGSIPLTRTNLIGRKALMADALGSYPREAGSSPDAPTNFKNLNRVLKNTVTSLINEKPTVFVCCLEYGVMGEWLLDSLQS